MFVILSSGCEKENKVQSREYPFLITKVEKVNSDGAVLKAEILYQPKLKTFNEVGFIISDKPIKSSSGIKLIVSDYKTGSDFSIHLRSLIKVNKIYYVRSYIIYDSLMTSVGPEVSFIGMGYRPLPLQINKIVPNSGTDGTPVRIEGSGFGYIPDSISLSIASIKMVVDKIEDNMILTRIPDNVPLNKNPIKITLYRKSLESVEEFQVFAPKVEDYSLKEGFDNSYFRINGHYFGSSKTCRIYIYNNLCKIISHTDSTLEAYTPEMSFAGKTEIKVVVGLKTSNINQFEVLTHTVHNIAPLTGITGTRVHVNGERFVVNGYTPVVKVSGMAATIYNISANTFSFIVPNVAKGVYQISVDVGKKSVVYGSLFNLDNSWISHYSALSRPMEEPITCQVGTDLYVGMDSDKKFWKYDILSHNWTELSSIVGLDNAQIWNKYLFYKDNSLFLSLNGAIYKYQIDQNRWTKICDGFINPFNWAVYYNGNLYGVESSYENGYDRYKIFKFNFENGSWNFLYNFPYHAPLFHFILGEKLYVWAVNNGYSGQFFEFNIEEGNLALKRRFPGIYDPYNYILRHIMIVATCLLTVNQRCGNTILNTTSGYSIKLFPKGDIMY